MAEFYTAILDTQVISKNGELDVCQLQVSNSNSRVQCNV